MVKKIHFTVILSFLFVMFALAFSSIAIVNAASSIFNTSSSLKADSGDPSITFTIVNPTNTAGNYTYKFENTVVDLASKEPSTLQFTYPRNATLSFSGSLPNGWSQKTLLNGGTCGAGNLCKIATFLISSTSTAKSATHIVNFLNAITISSTEMLKGSISAQLFTDPVMSWVDEDGNKHFYKVSSIINPNDGKKCNNGNYSANCGLSWMEAYNLSLNDEFYGLKGYMPTVVSQDENNLIYAVTSGTKSYSAGTRIRYKESVEPPLTYPTSITDKGGKIYARLDNKPISGDSDAWGGWQEQFYSLQTRNVHDNPQTAAGEGIDGVIYCPENDNLSCTPDQSGYYWSQGPESGLIFYNQPKWSPTINYTVSWLKTCGPISDPACNNGQYNNWDSSSTAPREPNATISYTGGEQCMHFNYNSLGQWNDYPCQIRITNVVTHITEFSTGCENGCLTPAHYADAGITDGSAAAVANLTDAQKKAVKRYQCVGTNDPNCWYGGTYNANEIVHEATIPVKITLHYKKQGTSNIVASDAYGSAYNIEGTEGSFKYVCNTPGDVGIKAIVGYSLTGHSCGATNKVEYPTTTEITYYYTKSNANDSVEKFMLEKHYVSSKTEYHLTRLDYNDAFGSIRYAEVQYPTSLTISGISTMTGFVTSSAAGKLTITIANGASPSALSSFLQSIIFKRSDSANQPVADSITIVVKDFSDSTNTDLGYYTYTTKFPQPILIKYLDLGTSNPITVATTATTEVSGVIGDTTTVVAPAFDCVNTASPTTSCAGQTGSNIYKYVSTTPNAGTTLTYSENTGQVISHYFTPTSGFSVEYKPVNKGTAAAVNLIEPIPSENAVYGSPLTRPTQVPRVEVMDFDNFYTSSACTSLFDFTKTDWSVAVQIYACFTPHTTKYDIYFNAQSHMSFPVPQVPVAPDKWDQVPYLTKINPPSTNPVLEGREFISWNTGPMTTPTTCSGNVWSFENDRITSAATLYACYAERTNLAIAYSVEGSPANVEVLPKNASVSLVYASVPASDPNVAAQTEPISPGYAFKSWNTAKMSGDACGGSAFDFTKRITASSVVYACFEPKDTLRIDYLSGVDESTVDVSNFPAPTTGIKYDQNISGLEFDKPQTEGQIFSHWCDLVSLGTSTCAPSEKFNFNTRLRTNLTLTAAWKTANKVNVNYIVNLPSNNPGNSFKVTALPSATGLTYGAEYTAVDSTSTGQYPLMTGNYTFKQWCLVPTTTDACPADKVWETKRLYETNGVVVPAVSQGVTPYTLNLYSDWVQKAYTSSITSSISNETVFGKDQVVKVNVVYSTLQTGGFTSDDSKAIAVTLREGSLTGAVRATVDNVDCADVAQSALRNCEVNVSTSYLTPGKTYYALVVYKGSTNIKESSTTTDSTASFVYKFGSSSSGKPTAATVLSPSVDQQFSITMSAGPAKNIGLGGTFTYEIRSQGSSETVVKTGTCTTTNQLNASGITTCDFTLSGTNRLPSGTYKLYTKYASSPTDVVASHDYKDTENLSFSVLIPQSKIQIYNIPQNVPVAELSGSSITVFINRYDPEPISDPGNYPDKGQLDMTISQGSTVKTGLVALSDCTSGTDPYDGSIHGRTCLIELPRLDFRGEWTINVSYAGCDSACMGADANSEAAGSTSSDATLKVRGSEISPVVDNDPVTTNPYAANNITPVEIFGTITLPKLTSPAISEDLVNVYAKKADSSVKTFCGPVTLTPPTVDGQVKKSKFNCIMPAIFDPGNYGLFVTYDGDNATEEYPLPDDTPTSTNTLTVTPVNFNIKNNVKVEKLGAETNPIKVSWETEENNYDGFTISIYNAQSALIRSFEVSACPIPPQDVDALNTTMCSKESSDTADSHYSFTAVRSMSSENIAGNIDPLNGFYDGTYYATVRGEKHPVLDPRAVNVDGHDVVVDNRITVSSEDNPVATEKYSEYLLESKDSNPVFNDIAQFLSGKTKNLNRHASILWMKKYGITTGATCPKGKKAPCYAPANSVNRGAMAEFLWALVGKPAIRGDKTAIELPDTDNVDLLANTNRRNAILWLASEGITVGSPGNSSLWVDPKDTSKGKQNPDKTYYNPTNTVTRGAMAEFMWKLASKPVSKNANVSLADISKVSGDRRLAVQWLANEGITVGTTIKGKIYYNPTGVVNRGAMAEFMKKWAVALKAV